MTDSIIHTALTGCQAVILDWDGTLADTQDRNYQALSAALAAHRVTIDRDWYRHHAGLPIRGLLTLVPTQSSLPIEQIIATSRAALLASTTPETLTAIPAAVDLARHALAAGLRCAVASTAARALVEAGLDVLKLRTLFHAVVTREDVTHGKPAPDTYLQAARLLDIPPRHCLAVEDTPDGLTAAQRAGMPVLLVRGGQLSWPAGTDIAPDPAEAART
jgi:beta-phosphoglucomutase-like phosphatase (HAD superfamily)